MTEKDIQRFWSKVDIKGEIQSHVPEIGKCWKWTGTSRNDGYAVFFYDGKYKKACRVCYELRVAPIPAGLLACHKCDNPNCVNPDHIFIGTHKANAQDKIIKLRHKFGDEHPMRKNPELASSGKTHSEIMLRVAARGDRSGARTHPENLKRGAENSKAKLTESQVLEIRQFVSENPKDSPSVSLTYGLSLSTIRRIVRRKTWKHI